MLLRRLRPAEAHFAKRIKEVNQQKEVKYRSYITLVKPRNLNQKRTQTRPKAVGTICPSDVAGREISDYFVESKDKCTTLSSTLYWSD